jgi:hypothetical protein
VTTVEVDPVLEALVGRLMEKDPARRPQSAREVRELLDLVDSDRLAALVALGMESPAPEPALPGPFAPPAPLAPARAPEPAALEPPSPEPPAAQRPELRTGKREPLPRPQSLRIAIIGVAALLVLALLVRIATRPQSPPAPPAAAQPSIVTVTVPLPVTVDRVAPAPVPALTPTPPTMPATSAPVQAPRAAPQKPARVAVATERTPGTIPTAAELAALYRDVGHTLEQLDRDSADSLWQRYRWIRIGDYLMSPDKRADAAAMLDAIASDARGK